MRRPLTGDDRRRATEQAVALYTGGATVQQVADTLDLGRETARTLLAEARTVMRRRGTYDRAAKARERRADSLYAAVFGPQGEGATT